VAAPTAAPRPGRALAVLAGALVATVVAMILTGAYAPKLAIDLAGGTSVTLTAKPIPGSEGGVTPQSMAQAVEIIRDRVNGFGVSEAEVTTLGSQNIVVSVPGQGNQKVVDLVGQTALLRFRQVLASGAPTSATAQTQPTPTPRPTTTRQPAATPTPGGSGRVVSRALEAADATPTPTSAGAATPSPAATPRQPAAPRISTTGTDLITPAVAKRFEELDCTQAENRQGGDLAKPTDVVAACDREGAAKYILGPAVVQGTDVTSAEAVLPTQGGIANWIVELSFDDAGTRAFADVTRQVTTLQPPLNQVAIVLDGVVVSAPTINEPITGGRAQIEGSFDQTEATDLANVLKYGALPLAFEKSQINTISATLGSDYLRGGLIAGGIGLGLTVLYCVFYYRGLGLVAVLSLGLAALIAYAAVSLLGEVIGYRLSLAGVAGLIVAIGITADSFVVFFERLRDELREGRSLRAAVEHGWSRARRTIIVADFVSFLAAAVLYLLSVDDVKGFAFTLGLTTLIDVAVVFLFTKPLVTLLARTRFFSEGHRMSGLNPDSLGVRRRAPLVSRRPTGVKEA
jgi:preprotein translocase subunit SecD